MIGVSGAGKSTFARKHFRPTEVVLLDYCRAFVSDDEGDQSATKAAFDVLHFVAARRVAAGRLTVVDATNVQAAARQPRLALARQYHVAPVAIVLDLPESLCERRNQARPDRTVDSSVIWRQSVERRRPLADLAAESFRQIVTLRTPEEVDAVTIERRPLCSDRRTEHGPVDVIGDVHGCLGELIDLLGLLGYQITVATDVAGKPTYAARPPDRRTAIFLGDLVDRGPNTVEVLRLVMTMVTDGTALCVPGNHDDKLRRKLDGRRVEIKEGLAETLAELDRQPSEFREQVAAFFSGLPSHLVLDDGKLVVAHAGMKENLRGRASRQVRDFALYGETTGKVDEYGLPERLNWAADYRGKAMVVYGHTPILRPEWLNNTINIDTGCVYGGGLTALRYPERELVSVPARQEYAHSKRLEIAAQRAASRGGAPST